MKYDGPLGLPKLHQAFLPCHISLHLRLYLLPASRITINKLRIIKYHQKADDRVKVGRCAAWLPDMEGSLLVQQDQYTNMSLSVILTQYHA